jgi:hypothetical protein
MAGKTAKQLDMTRKEARAHRKAAARGQVRRRNPADDDGDDWHKVRAPSWAVEKWDHPDEVTVFRPKLDPANWYYRDLVDGGTTDVGPYPSREDAEYALGEDLEEYD